MIDNDMLDQRIAKNQANIGNISGGNTHVGDNNFYDSEPQRDSELELVDLVIGDGNLQGFPKLDLKFRNIGGKVAFLKQVRFEVDKILRLRFKKGHLCT